MTVTLEMTDEEVTTPTNSEVPSGNNSEGTGEVKDVDETEIGQGAEAEPKTGDDSGKAGVDSAKAAEKTGEEMLTGTTSKELDKTQDEVRKYQADRDRAEQHLKNFYKEVLPYVEVDDYGRITGPKKSTAPAKAEPQFDVEALAEASAGGDKEATKTLLWIAKEQAKREAKEEMMGDLRSSASFETERQGIKKEFPDLYVKDESGKVTDVADENSPLFKETLKVIGERPYLNLSNPRDVRVAAIEAENRLLKAGLPEFEKKLKTEVQTRLKKTGAGTVAVSAGGGQTIDDLKGVLTDLQVERLKKEGHDEDGVKRIARIVKQAKKEGGFYL